jgi:hypothetical protein
MYVLLLIDTPRVALYGGKYLGAVQLKTQLYRPISKPKFVLILIIAEILSRS